MSRVRSLALLAAVCAFAGCYRWSAPLAPATPDVMRMRAGDLQVTPQTGRGFRLLNAQITGDTLRGDTLVNTVFGDVPFKSTVAIPLGDVRFVARREFSVGRTAAMAGFAALATYVVVNAVVNWVNGVSKRAPCLYICNP